MKKNLEISVIGLGYVGLPLALGLSKKFKVIGFDTNNTKVDYLKKKIDLNGEFNSLELKKYKKIKYTSDINEIKKSNTYIVALPTPILKSKKPDLKYLKNACMQLGKIIDGDDLIIFESTVYPGLTEEFCVPLLEKYSNKKLNIDFSIGYSPERINPGDKKNNLKNITKIISASNSIALKIMKDIYSATCNNLHIAESIKIAEGAKIIENIQRDINIALVNELSISFDKLNIDFNKVLAAANTKWNFQNYKPGLVGGHCIGIDPYYLAYKLNQKKYHTKLILAGREINDSYSKFISKKIYINRPIKKNKIIILGFAFKENVSDIRNSKVFDLYDELKKRYTKVDIYDPVVNKKHVIDEYKIKLINKINIKYDICILAVPHRIFSKEKFSFLSQILVNDALIYDLKNVLPKNFKYKTII